MNSGCSVGDVAESEDSDLDCFVDVLCKNKLEMHLSVANR